MINATRDYIDERDRELRNRATANYSALQRQIDALIVRQNTTAKFAVYESDLPCDSGGQGQVFLYSPSANPKTVWGLLA